MKKGEQDFLMRLANRALPGAGRVVRSVTTVGERIEALETKVAGLDEAVDKHVSELEKRLEDVSRRAAPGATTRDVHPEQGSEHRPSA